MDERLKRLGREAPGFLPEPEALALYEAGLDGGPVGPLLEIGSYRGKSAIYLGAAARETATVLFTIDHHRGSEEHQPGWEYHDPSLIDPAVGRIDTLPSFRRTIAGAGLEDAVVALVGGSATIARYWRTPLGLLFIDGSHTDESARADYEGWAPRVAAGGLLVIHDVFLDPAAGGQAPCRIYRRALGSGAFDEVRALETLRVLRRRAVGEP